MALMVGWRKRKHSTGGGGGVEGRDMGLLVWWRRIKKGEETKGKDMNLKVK